MLETKGIVDKFNSLKAYEKFNLDWTSACARLNPTEDNLRRLEVVRRREKILGLEE